MYKTEEYYCRGDKKGIRLEKLAMMEASKALWNSRISVMEEHYIR